MAELLASETPLPYLDDAARQSLEQLRRELGPHLREQACYLESNDKGLYPADFCGWGR